MLSESVLCIQPHLGLNIGTFFSLLDGLFLGLHEATHIKAQSILLGS
jgi:hypothetical protein